MQVLCFDFPLFYVLSLYLIETKARDVLLELVPFIALKQQLHETGCRSLSLCDLRAGVARVSHIRKKM